MGFIDYNYTLEIRSAIDSGESIEYSVFTEDEVDALLDGDFDDDAAGTIALAEEAIYRSTGIKVDLATQGAASDVVVREGNSPNQEHNTFIVAASDENMRDISTIVADHDTIPAITPQDANVLSGSLDYPATKPMGTILDGIRIDDKENPVEQAFISQVTFAQVMKHWGVSVEDLVEAINIEWGIDFAGKLVNDVAFARAAELEEFIASGGRPAPSIYMSPNILSQTKMVQTPTVDPALVGYSSAFIGRARVAAKFILTNTNVFRGKGALEALSVHMNPALMSKFDPSMLKDWTIPMIDYINPAHARSSVVALTTFDKFVAARQPLAVALRNDRVEVATVIERIALFEKTAITSGVMNYKATPANVLMSGKMVSAVERNNIIRDSDPKKIGPLLFDIFNGDADSRLYGNLVSACATTFLLASIDKSRLNLASIWDSICATKGIGEVVKTVNVAAVTRNDYVNKVMEYVSSSNPRMALILFMITRFLDYIRPTVRSVIESVWRVYNQGGRGVKAVGGAKIGGKYRPWKLIESMMLDTGSTKPFNHIKRYRAAATAACADISLMHIDSGALRWVAGDKSVSFHTAKPLGASIRTYWSKFYSDMCKIWENVGYIAHRLSTVKYSVHKLPKAKEIDRNYHAAFVAHVAYVEMVHCQAFKIAYKWAKVRVGGSIHGVLAATSIETATAFEIEHYLKYISGLNGKEPVIDIELDMGKGNVRVLEEMTAGAKYILEAFRGDKSINREDIEKTLRDMRAHRDAALIAVKNTTYEAVHNDIAAIGTITKAAASAPIAPVASSKTAVISGAKPAKSIADMIGQIDATTKVRVADPEFDSTMDRINAAVFDIAAVDEVVASTLDAVCTAVDREVYHTMKDDLDKLAAWASTIAGIDPDGVAYALINGGNLLIGRVAGLAGVTITKHNIME